MKGNSTAMKPCMSSNKKAGFGSTGITISSSSKSRVSSKDRDYIKKKLNLIGSVGDAEENIPEIPLKYNISV